MAKRGGKREGAGRPSQNSVIKPISLPLKMFQFVKENNLSLSKLAQQKIREEMAKEEIDYVFNKKRILELEFGEKAEQVAQEIYNELAQVLHPSMEILKFWRAVIDSLH